VYANKTIQTTEEALGDNAIIMDSEDSTGITISGDWTQSTYTGGFYGANYLHDQNSDSPKSVSYAPELGTIGDFEIFTRFAAAENRSSQTKYEIITKVDDEQVIETVLVDQTINTGKWISLGIYRLSGLTFPKVIISNENADGYVIADAVAFERQATLSIENTVNLEKLIKIYTVNKELIIQFNEEHSGSANIVVYNIYGKIIKTHKNVDLSQNNTKTSIGLDMSSGMYIVKVTLNGNTITKKIIYN
jgi:hypothetical protein